MRLILHLSVAILVSAFAVASDAQTDKTHNAAPTKSSEARPFRLSNPATMAKPVSTYSQIAEVTGGKTVYIAGQVGIDASGNLVSKDDFRAQVEQVFKNLKAAVEAAGGDMTNLVKTNYYVAESVDPALLGTVRELRDKYIDTAHPPTSTFVVVKRLVRPEYLIEVEAVAVIENKKPAR
jgi:2-iminobutanoate/2-iminopropanoate deaminase